MPATLPERLERQEKMMTARLDALKKTKATAVPLYNALSPEQKQTADALMMGMGMMGSPPLRIAAGRRAARPAQSSEET